MRRFAVLAAFAAVVFGIAPVASARVLRVGTYKGIRGQFQSLQAAVDAAKPGDWILIAPGDYKTSSSRHPASRPGDATAILITKRNLHIRGMNRNTVIIDGTKPGSAACSRKASAQNLGPHGSKGRLGLNGILVWEADNVSIQNLTACNFLGGKGYTGNEVWWDGGDGSGKIGGWGFNGSYLNATSTFYGGENSAAKYGIFSSNWSGGTFSRDYASNFNDSGFYIGACQQQCHQTMSHVWAEYSALGYSGSNSGGWMLIENSRFDNNEDGFDTNSQNGDNPPPQDGACPSGVTPPIGGVPSCWVFTHNRLDHNNNANVPAAGSAAQGPVGTGMSVSGGRDDTIIDNTFDHDNAWGVVFVPYTDAGSSCPGGVANYPLIGSGTCLWDDYGDALIDNSFSNDGGYHNPTNGQFDQLNFLQNPTDCFSGNTDASASLSPDATSLEHNYPSCSGAVVKPNSNGVFLNEVLCDSQVKVSGFGCQPGDHYPRRSRVIMHPLPKHLATMPNPCAGVPRNPWCGASKKH
jgi:hypothetical protein